MTPKNTLPALPMGGIDPGEPVVSFSYFECRKCGEPSEVVRDDADDKNYSWVFDHAQQHGGTFNYYKWSATRSTGRVGY